MSVYPWGHVSETQSIKESVQLTSRQQNGMRLSISRHAVFTIPAVPKGPLVQCPSVVLWLDIIGQQQCVLQHL